MTESSRSSAPLAVGRARRVGKALLAFVVVPIVLGALVVFVLTLTSWGNERVRRVVVSVANKRITGEVR